jgi:hypothetical protein
MRTATRMVVLNSKKYVLDLISAVIAAAYSLRRLYSSYTGAAIRVRRSSDNAQIDIGFIGEHLDVFALLAFVGNGSGFVTLGMTSRAMVAMPHRLIRRASRALSRPTLVKTFLQRNQGFFILIYQ